MMIEMNLLVLKKLEVMLESIEHMLQVDKTLKRKKKRISFVIRDDDIVS